MPRKSKVLNFKISARYNAETNKTYIMVCDPISGAREPLGQIDGYLPMSEAQKMFAEITQKLKDDHNIVARCENWTTENLDDLM